ncbi:hypothetical protein HK103_003432 [Boothiomyces macroporosus]|uniref:Peptidase C19 ubiquitin carboxyl-terminal hydrolase domain-containing protein n=1 Tax=Boothiomyces macroporosus TaxID=261099 RepID=A0AAD5UHW1_9FUNG|nr:hypothetical protein HK103_003432 [Boothiomyces macroporosus]
MAEDYIFIVSPPLEEAHSEPCLSWQPDEVLIQFPNLEKDPKVNLLNSALQLFTNLPFINNELPYNSEEKYVKLFTNILHSGSINLGATKSLPNLNDDDTAQLQRILKQNLEIEQVSHALDVIFESIILKTRFGQRFDLQPQYHQSPYIQIDLRELSHANTTLMSLLNNAFGTPVLFFGGQLLPKPLFTLPKLKKLPCFLLVSFNRHGKELNTTSVEFPIEIDVKQFLDPDLISTFKKSKGSPSAYQLHSFITQKDGEYMTYTRLRASRQWYKIIDSDIEHDVDMGHFINSAGVTVLLYRLKDAQ